MPRVTATALQVPRSPVSGNQRELQTSWSGQSSCRKRVCRGDGDELSLVRARGQARSGIQRLPWPRSVSGADL